LDTDFIVGTAIKYLTKEADLDCVWRHICDDPTQERTLCRELGSVILQAENATIRREFKLERPAEAPWISRDPQHIIEAEKQLYELFAKALKV